MTDRAQECAALLALMAQRPPLRGERTGTTSWSTIASEVALRGSAVAVRDELHPPVLGFEDSDGVDPELRRARDTLREWEADGGFDVLTVLDAGYPVALREIHQMPPLLLVKEYLHADEVAVSVIGSRDATDRGRCIAATVARALAHRRIAVISGLAEGIDGAAHEATLEVGGRPIGVIGTGHPAGFPASHRSLHERVGAAGALVSQFYPDAPPDEAVLPDAQRHHVRSGPGVDHRGGRGTQRHPHPGAGGHGARSPGDPDRLRGERDDVG